MRKLFSRSIIFDFIALGSGALLPLAFAPFHLFFLAILLPALLLAIWIPSSPRRALFRGWLFGIGFFGIGVSWVYVSLHTYGQAPAILAIFLTILFILTLALFIALPGYILNRWFPKPGASKLLLAYPSLWVLFEWIRSWLFTGFPWLFLGYSQTPSPLAHLAPLVSVYGVSFAVVFTSGCLVSFFTIKQRKQLISIATLLLITWIGSFLIGKIQWTSTIGNPISVSLIQGNVAQELKWNPQQVVHTLSLYRQFTLQNWNSQIIIWPEAAITVTPDQITDYLNELAFLGKMHNSTLIAGIPVYKNNQYYNGAIALGNGEGMYLKRHLVPFGEYMPFRWLLNWLNHFILIPMSDLASGPANQPLIIANGIPVAVFICYEIAYPEEVLHYAKGSQLIVTLSDDSWFGHSFALPQHLQIAQMRALETGRYLLVSTNDGITAIIAPNGKVLKQAPSFREFVLHGKIFATKGDTPLSLYGIHFIMGFVFLLFLRAFLLNNNLINSLLLRQKRNYKN